MMLKKFAMLIICAAMLSAATAFANEPATEAVPLKEAGTTTEIFCGMPNPFTDHASLHQAEKAAGYKIKLPKTICGSDRRVYRTGADILEVIYYKGDTEVARVRKAKGCHDISGDYNNHALSERRTTATGFLELKGDNGKYTHANRVENGYSYSVSTIACSKEDLQKLLLQIK